MQENSYTGATNNILGTINVLEAARLRKLRRVVYVSTFGVYDRDKITDSVVKETHPIGGHNLYGTTKICSEHLVHAYAACTTWTRSSFVPAAYSVAAFTSAAPQSARSCAISQ